MIETVRIICAQAFTKTFDGKPHFMLNEHCSLCVEIRPTTRLPPLPDT